jgi:RNA polymerase sigma-70 factor (ECF subfamily)
MRSAEAFEELFVHEYPHVVRMAFFIVHDQGRAEDVAQDAFVQLLRHWGKVENYDQPASWVRRVAIRLAVKTAKREQLISSAWTQVPPQRDEELAAFAVAPETWAALRQLSANERAVVVLHYFEDRPIDEIAWLLECSPSATKTRLHRARHRLAELLYEEVGSDVN